MEDGIFDEGFREVNTDIDSKDEILVMETAKEALFAAGKGDLAEETFRMGELDGDRRKRPTEEAGVELVKAGLDVWDGWNHDAKVLQIYGICKFLSKKYHFYGKKFEYLKKKLYLCKEFQE